MQPVNNTHDMYITARTKAQKNKPRILFRPLLIKINFWDRNLVTNPDIIAANKGFNISSPNSNFMLILLVMTFKLNRLEIIRLTSHPNIKAFIPLYGMKKYIKKRFMLDASKLFLNIKTCCPRPFRMPDKTICK